MTILVYLHLIVRAQDVWCWAGNFRQRNCTVFGSKKMMMGLGAGIAMAFAMPVWANNGYILKQGKEYPLCREMIEILNLPENTHSLSYRTVGKEFTIPKEYKNFQTVAWRQPTEEEISKYISPSTLQMLEDIKKRALRTERNWVDKGNFSVEVAQVEFDGDDTSLEIMLRYRLQHWKQWSCMFADTEPEGYRKALNPQTDAERGNRECTLLSYGDNIYLANGGAYSFNVYKPIASERSGLPSINGHNSKHRTLYFEPICNIEDPNWQPENPQPKGISK
jgi:hypothetical protein